MQRQLRQDLLVDADTDADEVSRRERRRAGDVDAHARGDTRASRRRFAITQQRLRNNRDVSEARWRALLIQGRAVPRDGRAERRPQFGAASQQVDGRLLSTDAAEEILDPGNELI